MTTSQRRAFFILMAAAFGLCVWVVIPTWVPVFFGVMMAITLAPWHERMVARWPHPRLVAAGLTLTSLLVLVATLGAILFVVARELVPMMQAAIGDLRSAQIQHLFDGQTGRVLNRVGFGPEKLQSSLSNLLEMAAAHVTPLVSQVLSLTSSGMLGVIFAALTSYYLLVDGEALLSWGERVSPLPRTQTRSLYREFRDVVRGTLLGTGVTAVFQGTVSGIGYSVLHVPHALMWAALTGVGSLVPGLGTTLVWAPVGIVLLATGATWRGVGVLVFGAVVIVGAADYLLRPLIIGGQMRLHALLVFIALFGGLEAFGLLGLVLGPLLMSLFVALLRIYERDYRMPPTQTPAAASTTTPATPQASSTPPAPQTA